MRTHNIEFGNNIIVISINCIEITFHEFSDADVIDLLFISEGDKLESITHLKSAWSCCSTLTTYSCQMKNVELMWVNQKMFFQSPIHRIPVTLALTVCASTVSAEGMVTIHLDPSSNNLPVSILELISFNYLYNIALMN